MEDKFKQLCDENFSHLHYDCNPIFLLYMSYDSCYSNGVIPKESIVRFTIDGLKMIFPHINIESDGEKIIVEGIELVEYSALPNKEHIDYIKEVMVIIFSIYENDEVKIPKDRYKWWFNKENEKKS